MNLQTLGGEKGSHAAADLFGSWVAAIERRHLARLGFPEVRHALQALSSLYVERRVKLASGAALDTIGKRAAFAVFYAPLHFLTVREVVRGVGAAAPVPGRIADLGCGTGAAGAAWALEAGGRPVVLGIDRSGWAVEEAAWTLGVLGIRGEARRASLERAPLPGSGAAVLAAFTLNELAPAARGALLGRLLDAARRGACLLVIEPLSRRVAPWWDEWADAFACRGGRRDEWRFRIPLPGRLRELDRAAGLDHGALRARSLWLPGRRREALPGGAGRGARGVP